MAPITPITVGLLICIGGLLVALILNGLILRDHRRNTEDQISRAFTRGKLAGAELERRRVRNQSRIARRAARRMAEAVEDPREDSPEAAARRFQTAFEDIRNG